MTLPEDWVLVCQMVPLLPLSEIFPDVLNRDPAYESARNQSELTWQKVWWRMSGGLDGLLLRALCGAWSCTVEDLLAPIERRHWSDPRTLDEPVGPVEGYVLRRPSKGR
ncbi:hypothetical protein [Streptomyces spiralis]|uniref:hypothetical protein n=1 Tax=Streptomyces spiralis TaxID=66376 RepID=UPI0036BE3138